MKLRQSWTGLCLLLVLALPVQEVDAIVPFVFGAVHVPNVGQFLGVMSLFLVGMTSVTQFLELFGYEYEGFDYVKNATDGPFYPKIPPIELIDDLGLPEQPEDKNRSPNAHNFRGSNRDDHPQHPETVREAVWAENRRQNGPAPVRGGAFGRFQDRPDVNIGSQLQDDVAGSQRFAGNPPVDFFQQRPFLPSLSSHFDSRPDPTHSFQLKFSDRDDQPQHPETHRETLPLEPTRRLPQRPVSVAHDLNPVRRVSPNRRQGLSSILKRTGSIDIPNKLDEYSVQLPLAQLFQFSGHNEHYLQRRSLQQNSLPQRLSSRIREYWKRLSSGGDDGWKKAANRFLKLFTGRGSKK